MNTASKPSTHQNSHVFKLLKNESTTVLVYPQTDSFHQHNLILDIFTSKYDFSISIRFTYKLPPLCSKMTVSEPYICIPGVPNFRDIGGYPIASEKTKQVRRNVVYRSALPRDILDGGSKRAQNKLQTLNINQVFDLRSETEFLDVRAYDWRQWLCSEMHRVSAPVFQPEEYNSDLLADQYMESGCGPEVCQILNSSSMIWLFILGTQHTSSPLTY